MNQNLRAPRVAAAAIAFALSLLAVAPAEAGTITLVRDTGANGYSGDNGGGEMGVSVFTGADVVPMASNAKVAGSSFQTFCIEKNESFNPGVNYQWTLSAEAHNGGVSGQTGPGIDPISAATAFVYTQFYFGQLANYDYTLGDGRKASAAQLQNAIWYLENEISSLDVNSQAWAWVQQANEATDGDGFQDTWSGGIGNVRVLTITDASGGVKQDQLFMVPLPPALYLGFGGLAGLGLMRLRRRKNSA